MRSAASRGGRTSSISAPSTAASGRPSTADGSGNRFSMHSRSRRLVRSRCPAPRPTRSTSDLVSRRCVTRRVTATACTSRPTPARRGPTSVWTTRSTSAKSPSTPRIRTLSSSRSSGTSMRATPIAAYSGPRMAARPGRRCCSRTTASGPATSRSIPPTPASCTPRCGTRAGRPGTRISRPTGRAAACSNRPTAARPGTS